MTTQTQNLLPDTITLQKQFQEVDNDLRQQVVKVQTAYPKKKPFSAHRLSY